MMGKVSKHFGKLASSMNSLCTAALVSLTVIRLARFITAGYCCKTFAIWYQTRCKQDRTLLGWFFCPNNVTIGTPVERGKKCQIKVCAKMKVLVTVRLCKQRKNQNWWLFVTLEGDDVFVCWFLAVLLLGRGTYVLVTMLPTSVSFCHFQQLCQCKTCSQIFLSHPKFVFTLRQEMLYFFYSNTTETIPSL